MKRTMVLAGALLLCAGCISVRGAVIHERFGAVEHGLRHVVMYAYNDDATPAQREALEAALRELPRSKERVLNVPKVWVIRSLLLSFV